MMRIMRISAVGLSKFGAAAPTVILTFPTKWPFHADDSLINPAPLVAVVGADTDKAREFLLDDVPLFEPGVHSR